MLKMMKKRKIMIDEPVSICNHGILHKMTKFAYQCMSCKEEFEVDIALPPFNQTGNVITE
jgi:hypothetical protein